MSSQEHTASPERNLGYAVSTFQELRQPLSIVVIGGGPSAIRFAKSLLEMQPRAHIRIFSDDPYVPYNRIQLSSFLAGNVQRDALDVALPSNDYYPNFSYIQSRITQIVRQDMCVIDAQGQSHRYDKLVIATGARAFIPTIPANDAQGVFTFRNMRDSEALYARAARARELIVVGGGLLGIEAAKALHRMNTQVTLIQQAPRLMNRQLDDVAADMLKARIESLGIRVITGDSVRNIETDGYRVEGIVTHNKQHIACDTVLFCTGITPNTDLARAADLKVARGIVVNDSLQTSDANIHAIGECAEHNGVTYGLASPCLEQATVAANVIAYSTHLGSAASLAFYKGSQTSSRLKVLGETVCSIGQVSDYHTHPLISVLTYRNRGKGIYRKIIISKNRLLGVVSYGEWQELERIQEAFTSGREITMWNRWRFRLTGQLFSSSQVSGLMDWPSEAIVCQCNNLTRGQLSAAVAAGCDTLDKLQHDTAAGTVCGTCKPLLPSLFDAPEQAPSKEFAWLFILVLSILAVLAAVSIPSTPELDVAMSVQTQPLFEQFWNDKFWKQVTGFTLLGLSVLGLMMSARKRMNWRWMGNFGYWRLLHIVLSAVCIVLLIVHTGFHMGSNLNRWLMINFLSLALLGTLVGFALALSHQFRPSMTQSIRKASTWLHIFASWPLPALLSMHILSVYYF